MARWNKQRDPEAATNLFAELQESYHRIPNYRDAYQLLSRTFLKSLDEKTYFAGIRFNGPFAKADYLLKEYQARPYLKKNVNDARVHLRGYKQKKDEELAQDFLFDFQAICLFISLIYNVPVPSTLKSVFPERRKTQRRGLKTECLRIIVNRWDDTYIYADADVENTDEVKVYYGGKNTLSIYKDWDWSYLKTLLTENCQLNIVRPLEVDGVLYPELFIVEPDLLIDISAIAACFENYGVTSWNYLLNKIKSVDNTQSIVLGNLASQFLDETLFGDCSYKDSINTFFKNNALSLLTADLGAEFHAKASAQKTIIQQTIRNIMPEMLHEEGIQFDSSEIMVEPSFFSEMLGLQGRMDFLHLGQKVLLEQKSGKAKFPESDPPKQQEKHYVQLILYMLLLRYNYRETYEKNHRRLYSFLFYSKYQKGLIPLGFAPDLIFDAIKLRNEIATQEYAFCQDGLKILSTLTADSFNINKVSGPLWEKHQKPQIESLLSPIRSASELERTFYLRFFKFLETEHLMAKVGTQTKENSGFADKWHSSLDDKLLAGNIYLGLELLSPDPTEKGKVEHLQLGFKEGSNQGISNFRTGDIVILYPYPEGEEPDARKTMVFRATIERITSDNIYLNLRASQTSGNVFWYQGKREWAIEHDFFDSSFSSLYRGIHSFLSAPKERKDLLLLQRTPEVDSSKTLSGEYGEFNNLVLRAKEAKDLFLIIGPPGTGKTSFGLLNILQEELLSTQDSILLLSYTNRAVDEICGKLIEKKLDFIRIGGKYSCEEACRPFLLDSKVEHCGNISQLKETIKNTRIFVGTTNAVNANINLFKLKHFSLAIVDEASQILEPHLMSLLAAQKEGRAAISKFVMIGDHKQLPAVVQQTAAESRVEEPALRNIGLTDCRLSLFERLLKRYGRDPHVTYQLTRQGRMHPAIARFPNEAFYGGTLREVPLPHQEAGPSPIGWPRLQFIDVPAAPSGDKATPMGGKVNLQEAAVIAQCVSELRGRIGERFTPDSIGVIVPYRHQIAAVRAAIVAASGNDSDAAQDITIDTVERYQGSQRDTIIYGFTVSHPAQLDFLTEQCFCEDGQVIDRKLNVALTRAREHLVLVGNAALLRQNPLYARLIDFTHQAFN